MAQHHRDFFEFILELVLAQCSNLMGLSLKPQRLFRVYFRIVLCPVLEFNGFNSLISPL